MVYSEQGAAVAMNETGRPGLAQWTEGISKYHVMVFIGCWLGGIFDGMDSTLMSVVMPVALKELLGTTDKATTGTIAAYLTSLFLFGWMAGGILFGIIGDKLGRVKSMVFSILLYALFTGLAGFAPNWQILALCRFLTGLGIGGELVTISTFLTEVWPTRSRAIAIGVLITSYQAGVFIAGSINSLITVLDETGRNLHIEPWRFTFFIGALPALLVIFLRMALKESDRWMEAKERQMHGETEVKTSQLKLLFNRENARGLLVGGLVFCGLLIGYWASLSWIPMWIQDLLQESGDGSERGIATMYQGVAAVIGCSMAGVFSDWIGRRNTIIFSYLGCFLASALLFLTNSAFSPIIYWQCAILGYFIGLAQAVMYIYLPELFPTLVRATATGFCLNVGRFVTAVSVFFVGDLIRLITAQNLGLALFGNAQLSAYAVAAFLFATAYLISVGSAFFGDETRGRALLD